MIAIEATCRKPNHDFWEKKIAHNKERDTNNYAALAQLGWDYLVIWQCEIKKSRENELRKKISHFLS